MKRQVWSIDEIRDILIASNEVSGMTASMVSNDPQDVARVQAYRQGFKAALVAVGLALGLTPLPAPVSAEAPTVAECRGMARR